MSVHVTCLVLKVAPACDGDDLLLLLDRNRELYRRYRDQDFLDFLKVSKGSHRSGLEQEYRKSQRGPTPSVTMLLRAGVLYGFVRVR